MPEDKKSWMQMAIGMMRKDKDDKKKKKLDNMTDEIKKATQEKNKALADIYKW